MMAWLRRRHRLEAAQDVAAQLSVEVVNTMRMARESRAAGFHMAAAALESDALAIRDALADVERILTGRRLTIWLGQE